MSKEVFLEKTDNHSVGLNVYSLFHLRGRQKGDVGLEVEVEGNQFPKEDHPSIPSTWSYHHDGSLRGNDNAEYVLRKPVKFADVSKEVQKLWGMFKECGSVLEESNRTSVHVHLNVQEFHLNRLCSFMALYFSVEEILTAWCGENRIGNMFCLRAKDAYGIVTNIKRFLQDENSGAKFSDGLHYSGLNAQALQKFGSVEIRSLRGATEPQIIIDWVGILQRIYELSAEFKDPREVCEKFSGCGAMNYFETVLGDKSDMVRTGVCMDTQEIMTSLYDGIRIAQDLCYCRDWSKYKPVDLKPDPFGRSNVKILEQMQSSGEIGPIYYGVADIETAPSVPYTGLTSLTAFHQLYMTTPLTTSSGNPAPGTTQEEVDENDFDPFGPHDYDDMEDDE